MDDNPQIGHVAEAIERLRRASLEIVRFLRQQA